MLEQMNSSLVDLIEQAMPAGHVSDRMDEEPVSWEAAWIDIGGEG